MMNAKEAVMNFVDKRPNLIIMKAAVYDNDLYIFEAVEDPDKPDYNSPYYLMDKNTGEIAWFSPTVDLEKFHKAFRDNQISITGG